jgi:hypothetical protein
MPVPVYVTTCVLAAPSAATSVRNVYGGNLLIGATNNPFTPFGVLPPTPPFDGGFTSVAGHAPGSFAVSVATALKQVSIAVNDPAGFAFGPSFFATQPPLFATFLVQPNFGNAPLSQTLFATNLGPFGSPIRVAIPTPYNATHNTLTVETLNPWDIANGNMEICGGINCFALTATPPFTIQRPFADAGTDLAFFNWKTSGTATAISQLSPSGYKVTISGPGTATLTTTTASVLIPRQMVNISGTSFTPGGLWTLTANDAASNTYANSAVASALGGVTIVMNSVDDNVTTTKIIISFATIAPGSVTISSVL